MAGIFIRNNHHRRLHDNVIRSASRFCCHFFVLGCLLSLLLFTPPVSARALQDLGNDHLLSIEMKNMNFQQVIDAVAAKMNMTIVLHGEQPIVKRDISFSTMPLEQALGRIMRLYGVENHAEIFNTDNNNLVRVDVHLYSTTGDVPNLQTQNAMDVSDSEKPLTFDQMSNLIAQSELIEEELKESALPLTPEQTERLRLQSEELEAEINTGSAPLTSEQLANLKERSQMIELEEQHDQTLSSDQLQRLRQNSSKIEMEMERAQQPLSEEQVLRLQERGKD
jgi:hypothetical protein